MKYYNMQLSYHIFKKKLESGKYELLDVRTLHEQTIYGVISKNQLLIDIYSLDAIQQIQKLPKDKKYLIYCWHWSRSQYVVSIMKEMGIREVYDLEGGIDVWNKNSLQIRESA